MSDAMDRALSMDQQAGPLLPARRQTEPSGVDVILEPLLDLGGYAKATDYEVWALTHLQVAERSEYWTRGEGAKVFLTEVAAALNASPHLKDQPFELVMTRIMQMGIEARVEHYSRLEAYDLQKILMGYADEVATDLLGNFVRARRWKLYEEPGRMPRPFTRPSYTGGQNPRGGPFEEFLVGRTTPTISHEQYERWLLENNLQ